MRSDITKPGRKYKKRFICTILAVVMGACLISCGDNEENKTEPTTVQSEQSKEDDSVEKDNTSSKSTETKNSANSDKSTEKSTSSKGKKKTYKEKLDSIQAGLSDLESYYSGTTTDMKYAAGEEYKRWDGALNEIYGELKKDLSKSEVSALEKEETNWIKEKEDKAKNAAEQYKGGTAEGLNHTASLAESTKNRCYELVDKYMK